MKRILFPLCCAALAPVAMAQSAVDALSVTQSDFKGTARFMSMGGAFTALGGDLSAINQNPAGIGVYRHSEIGATLDIDFQKTKGADSGIDVKYNQTKVFCNNFGYVGAVQLDGALRNFNWGVTYNRAASFDRLTGGYANPVGTSLTNYIASFSNGYPAQALDFADGYNPYQNGYNENGQVVYPDWLSVLAYTSYMINPRNGSNVQYQGLYVPGTISDAALEVRERGYVDNYEFTFGGNFSDVVYWGLGIGVNDLKYTREAYYSESMSGARINNGDILTNGNAGFYLDNYKHISGTGWNIQFGVIVKPVQEFRVGFAIQSPTWYSLDQSYVGETDFSYTDSAGKINSGSEYTDEAYFNWKLRSPWRFSVGVAGVIGSKAIVSLDYERKAYNDMTAKVPMYDNHGFIYGYEADNALNDEIKTYSQASNTIRLGVEYRITSAFSARLGFNTTTTNIKSVYREGTGEVVTTGTDPSYSTDKTTTYITAGLGYKIGNWYIDGTYVHKTRKSVLHPYTSYASNGTNSSIVEAPAFDVSDNNNSIVLSVGFKF